MPDFGALPITTAQLRERVGGALADDRLAGFVLDADLDALVEENRSALLAEALTNAEAAVRSDRPVRFSDTLQSQSAEGFTIPADRFPFPFGVVGNGGQRARFTDPDRIESYRTAAFARYRFSVRGRLVVMAFPGSVQGVTLTVAPLDEGIAAYADVAAGNARTVEAAYAMLQRRAAEQARQETDEPPED